MMSTVVNFSLDPDADRDIVRWLDSQANKSAAIRAAIRAHMAKEQGVTLADVLAEIRALPSRMRVVAPGADQVEAAAGEEPIAAAANLDGLLDRLDGEWD
jgi:cell pole-organizing protein PopZ